MTDDHTAALRALVGIGDAETPQAALETAASLAGRLVDADLVLACWAARGDPVALTAVAGDAPQPVVQRLVALFEDLEPSSTRWSMSLDGLDGDDAAGVLGVRLDRAGNGGLAVVRRGGQDAFTDADEALLLAVAKQTALALAGLGFAGERRRLQDELRTAERLKTEFVAMTSHELRTPLTSIRAATSMIRSYWETINEERKLRLLEVIEGQAQRLSRLVENILAAANIEAGVVLPRVTSMDLATAADDVARDFALELDVKVDCERPLMVEADPDHVRQILVNFVGNALKYGQPPVSIVGRHLTDHLEMRVTDAGPGVPPDFVPLLFHRFTQASRGDSRHASGSGLGLSIVKGLAEAMGGSVRYEAVDPQGSSFVLTLPAPNGQPAAG